MRIVQLASSEGPINLQIDEPDQQDGRMSFSAGTAIDVAVDSFEQALRPIQSAARIIAEHLTSPILAANEIEVEFGVKLSSKVGFYIAKADGEASFKITLKWQRDRTAHP